MFRALSPHQSFTTRFLSLTRFPNLHTLIIIKGGGGGVHPDFFVKLGFEIAVDQQTRTGDQTFEGVPDPNHQSVPAGQPRPYLVQIGPNLAKYPEHAQNPKKCPANFGIWPPNFFKGLTQNSNRKLKVMRQFYVDSENFMKKY